MDRSDVITLVGASLTQDAFGVWRETTTEREVFCSVESVTRSEYFEGGKNGLVPELVFKVFDGDYNDEKTAIYDGRAYGIYRTFRRKSDVTELYAERKGGVNVVPEPEAVVTDVNNTD